MTLSKVIAAIAIAAATIPEGSWLLTYAGKPINTAIGDRRMLPVIRDRVPATLVGRVFTTLSASSETVSVAGGRFVTMTGCGARDCRSNAYLWIDAKGTAAIGVALERTAERTVLTIGSKGVAASELQGPALASIRAWLAQNDVEPDEVQYVGPSNTPRSLDPEPFRPHARE
ncbi:MAG TPA: hypothetical protein VEU08_08610 [Vicinamibacterales bacterium]|nr:hypothetical protein [Vicinamibacterales bacterium]